MFKTFLILTTTHKHTHTTLLPRQNVCYSIPSPAAAYFLLRSSRHVRAEPTPRSHGLEGQEGPPKALAADHLRDSSHLYKVVNDFAPAATNVRRGRPNEPNGARDDAQHAAQRDQERRCDGRGGKEERRREAQEEEGQSVLCRRTRSHWLRPRSRISVGSRLSFGFSFLFVVGRGQLGR